MGRPSTFTQKTANIICERLADGESLRAICADEDMPGRATVFQWLAANESFADQYARARDAQADAIFDEILHIADTPQMGQKSVSKATGLEITEGDMIEHRRLQVEARKWVAGKLRPKKYGDKIQAEHTGADGSALQIQIVRFGAADGNNSTS
jgi:hypothetical protein